MSVTINGSTGVTTPGISNSEGYTGDGLTIAAGAPSGAVQVDTSGNLGLGVTPSAWGTFKAFQIGSGSLFALNSNANTRLGANYYHTGSAEIYLNSALASSYNQVNGQHQWFTAPSGTAGNAISFTQAMTLDSSGNLLVGTTSGPSASTKMYAYVASAQDDNHGIIQAYGSQGAASIIAKTPNGTTQLFQWLDYGSRIGSRAASGANGGTLYWTAGNDVVGASLRADKLFQVGNVGPGSGGAAISVFGGSGGDIVQFHQSRNGSTPYWYFNTSGGYGVYSDARLKENITNTTQADSVEFIKNLQVVEFNWKPEFGDNTRRISGFLAQNVLASAKTEGQKNILTNWETYDENDPECPKMGLSDHRVIPSVVQALQAAMTQIEEQQAIINAQQTQISDQLAALESLTARVVALDARLISLEGQP